uniref:Uncharacterized protein n=1 Tax=Romanomermis culicivorax TaxID=13658 RepID=A0A915JQN8_ROMCU
MVALRNFFICTRGKGTVDSRQGDGRGNGTVEDLLMEKCLRMGDISHTVMGGHVLSFHELTPIRFDRPAMMEKIITEIMSDKLQLPYINQSKQQVHYNSGDNVADSSLLLDGDFVVKLNVGGARYATLKSSLCKFEHSLLYQWFKDVALRPYGSKSAESSPEPVSSKRLKL